MFDSVPLFDPWFEYQRVSDAMNRRVGVVLRQGRYVLGPEVREFEKRVAQYLGVEAAVGVASGTDALVLALRALDIGRGDAVLTTPFTFVATAEAIAVVGARPLFVDIDPVTLNICPERVAELLTRECELTAGEAGAAEQGPRLLHRPTGTRLRALLPVHLFGRLAPMRDLGVIADRYRLDIVEDAAQAFGTVGESAGARPRAAGAWGRAGCHSFFPTKNLAGAGDGGLVTTHEVALAERVRRLRAHGTHGKYRHAEVGLNSRLDTLQAAILIEKLTAVDDFLAARRENVARYRGLFAEAERRGVVRLPEEPADGSHSYNQFVIRVPRRESIIARFEAAGVGHAVYYPIPLHLQPCFEDLGYRRGDFPEAENAAEEVLALPVYPGLTEGNQVRVVDHVLEATRDWLLR